MGQLTWNKAAEAEKSSGGAAAGICCALRTDWCRCRCFIGKSIGKSSGGEGHGEDSDD